LHEILFFEVNRGLKHFNIYRFDIAKICPKLHKTVTVTGQVEEMGEYKKLPRAIRKIY
jgi:hypothetical protein